MSTEKSKNYKPIIVVEQFADNGELSHYHLTNADTGEVLWSSFPEETIARGEKIVPTEEVEVLKELLKGCVRIFEQAGDVYNSKYKEAAEYVSKYLPGKETKPE